MLGLQLLKTLAQCALMMNVSCASNFGLKTVPHAARYKRTAELVKVQQELDSVDRRRGELRSLLAVYSDE